MSRQVNKNTTNGCSGFLEVSLKYKELICGACILCKVDKNVGVLYTISRNSRVCFLE